MTLIHPWDPALDDAESRAWIGAGHDFGQLVVNGLPGQAPGGLVGACSFARIPSRLVPFAVSWCACRPLAPNPIEVDRLAATLTLAAEAKDLGASINIRIAGPGPS